MARGRPKGVKNSKGHKSGGDRKSQAYKLKKIENNEKAKNFFKKKIENNREKKNISNYNIQHPLSTENLRKSQELLLCVLNHNSMPRCKFSSHFGIVNAKNEIDYTVNHTFEDNTYSYLPSAESPLGSYLSSIREKVKGNIIYKNKEIILPQQSTLQNFSNSATADSFYQNVIVYNFDPFKYFKLFGDECKCIYCGGTKLQTWGK